MHLNVAMDDEVSFSSAQRTTLESLPPEILHNILLFLDIPDLLSVSRVSHVLRRLAVDPHLHHARLASASSALEVYLSQRPPISSLRPPTSSILLSRTHTVARAISRSLISIRLSRNLLSRPSAATLIDRHILPAECVGYFGPVAPGILQPKLELGRRVLRERLRGKLERRLSVEKLVDANILPGELYGINHEGRRRQQPQHLQPTDATRQGNHRIPPSSSQRTYPSNHGFHPSVVVSPGILGARRAVIKEGLKDGLRAWIERRAILVEKRARHEEDDLETLPPPYTSVSGDTVRHQQRASVKLLVRRFTRSITAAQQHQQYSINRKGEECTCERHAMMRRAKGRAGTRKWERPALPTSMNEQQQVNDYRIAHGCSQPTRAHVLGLRRFWESVIRSSA